MIVAYANIPPISLRAQGYLLKSTMADKLSDLEMDAWQALLHAHFGITRVLDAELREEHGLTWSGYDVLVRLARVPEHQLPMTELARRVMMSPSGLTRAVDTLVAEKLVVREREAGDGRVVF